MAAKPGPLSAGDFNRRATFEIDTATASDIDKNGAQLEVWDRAGTAFDTWVSYEALPSRPGSAEYFADPKRRVENRALFKVRYSARNALINPATYRIIYAGTTWNIARVLDPDGGKVEIHIETNSIT